MLWRTVKNLVKRTEQPNKTTFTTQALDLLHNKYFEEAESILQDQFEGQSNPTALELALLGEASFHLEKTKFAEELFHRALKLQPGLAEGHYGLSLIYYEAGRHEDALAQALYARNRDPANSRILSQLGLCHIAFSEYGPAREILRQAVLIDPRNVPALNNYAIALHAMGDLSDAWYYLNLAIETNPSYEPALDNIRNLFTRGAFQTNFDISSGSFDTKLILNNAPSWSASDLVPETTLELLEAEYETDPTNTDAAAKLINAYLKALRLQDAADILNTAQAHNENNIDLVLISARLADQLGQHNRARKHYEKALIIEPDNVIALLGLGHTLKILGQTDDALTPIEKAVSLEESPQTLLSLAFTQCTACKYTESLSSCARLEIVAPHLSPFLITTRAVCHAYLGNFDEAIKYADQADDSEIQSPGFSVFRGMLDLMHENYLDGWKGYANRFYLNTTMKRLLPYPRWNGENIAGKNILVLAEQGLGDQVMFASCLPDLLSLRPKKIILEANHRVEKTLARSFPVIEVLSSNQRGFEWLPEGSEPDFYVPLADLPRFFRNAICDFPAHTGYLTADSHRIEYWKKKLGESSARPKVGISWRGGLQITRQAVRTLPLEKLTSILSDNRIQFVNLQYGDVDQEIQEFAQPLNLCILNFPEAIQDLDEFAALISSLDLIITVCNTTVHYTGALGCEGWVLAPHVPEWRYGLTSDTMRWYPSIRMFRQQSHDGWDNVLADLRIALDNWLSRSSSSHWHT